MAASEPHLDRLTSIRGIACVVVLLGHTTQVLRFDHAPGAASGWLLPLLDVLCNAHAAVMLFFVLSGCVLAKSFQRDGAVRGRGLLAYYVKRGLRLYPLLWASVVLAVASVVALRGLPSDALFQDWLARNLATPVEPVRLAMSFAGAFTRYNGPMWSLRVEILYSLILPFLFLLLVRRAARWWVLAGLGLLALVPAPEEAGLHYGIAFGLGVLIPTALPDRRLLGPTGVVLALAGLILLRAPLQHFGASFKTAQLAETALSFGVVQYVYVTGRDLPSLSNRLLVWIGDISYSIYLLHLPVFLLLFLAYQGMLGLDVVMGNPLATVSVLTAATLVVSAALSVLTFRGIEMPFHGLGRSLARRIEGRAPVVAGTPAERADGLGRSGGRVA